MWIRRYAVIAGLTLALISAYLLLRFYFLVDEATARWPLWLALGLGGVPLVVELVLGLLRLEFGSDLLAGISIVTAILLGEYLAGTLVVLMLSGGAALESYAVRRASSVLDALARRMPSVAHRRLKDGLLEVPIAEVQVGDLLVVLPHESCPVDGLVVEGHGSMDEAYLTGEPYEMSKSVGSPVLSGAINGAAALTIRATRLPKDSRYAQIMQVMQHSQQQRPRIRRLGDQLGAFYTPLALAIAVLAWNFSGDPLRLLSVLVIATPCPLLIAIPVAIIGSISLSARRGIVIRDPAVLERIGRCSTMIFDKTGTLTYGKPSLVEQHVTTEFNADQILELAASLEQYSKHPLAASIVAAARDRSLNVQVAQSAQELPGQGLRGVVLNHEIRVTSAKQLLTEQPELKGKLPAASGGLECVILVDGHYAATYRFRDEPRSESASFVEHLLPHHGFDKLMLVSGDRLSEVEYLAQRVGITEIHAGKSPEEKLAIVQAETARSQTVYVGDGINDAPAMQAATVGLALGQNSDVTAQASGAVLLNSMLGSVDELLHIGLRMRRIALQSALGGMALSFVGMLFAAAGYLPPVAGAVLQEAIDVLAVMNALRAALPPAQLRDYE
ncbi:MAG: cadmium-translocating P-type ATPase [Pirellulaceae bacterium]|nr:cadmium-translocating P-type ATPase [Pirellulaceae bacterium]